MALSTFSTMNMNWPFNPCDHVHNTHNLLTPRAMPTRGGGEQSERHASIDLNDKGSLLQNKKHYFFHHDISTKHKNMTFLLSYNRDPNKSCAGKQQDVYRPEGLPRKLFTLHYPFPGV